MTEAEDLRAQLCDAIKARAMVYKAVHDELAAELGAERAADLLKRAIYKRGVAVGARFKHFAPADFAGLRDAFLDFVPGHGALFAPEVQRCDEGGLDIRFHRCPLKEAWLEAGLAEAEVARLCAIAGIIDNGIFEEAGFALASQTWTPGREGCCSLYVRPPDG